MGTGADCGGSLWQRVTRRGLSPVRGRPWMPMQPSPSGSCEPSPTALQRRTMREGAAVGPRGGPCHHKRSLARRAGSRDGPRLRLLVVNSQGGGRHVGRGAHRHIHRCVGWRNILPNGPAFGGLKLQHAAQQAASAAATVQGGQPQCQPPRQPSPRSATQRSAPAPLRCKAAGRGWRADHRPCHSGSRLPPTL